MTSAAFLSSIVHDHERRIARGSRVDTAASPDHISSKAADGWRDTFGIDEDDIAEFTELAHDPAPSAIPPKPTPRQASPGSELPEDVIREAMRMLEEDG